MSFRFIIIKIKIEKSKTPIYRIGGWYDGALANSAIKGFRGTKNSVKLLVGPWDHGPAQHISPFVHSNKKHFLFGQRCCVFSIII
ncbi:MAG: hypothetical protein IPF58_16065 [Saprospirales bacterium]|nr:hypothetical protein [Saprospirales bacterium]